MDGQVAAGEEHTLDPAGSVLDRGLSIPITATAIISTLAVVIASLFRLPELDRWAFSPEEGAIALAARNLVRGASIPDDMLGQPFVIEWVALFMFLGDTTLSVARVSMAVAGIIAILGVLVLRPLLGALPAALAALLLAFSPTFISASRTLDGGVLTITLSILVFAAALQVLRGRGLVYPALTGIALALLLLTGPIGLPAAALTFIGIYLTFDDEELPDRSQWLVMGAGFAVAYVLFSSAMLTQPSSIYESRLESLSMLWNDHITNIGDGLQLALWNLLLNEPLILLLAIAGFVWGRQLQLVRALGSWAVVNFVIISLLGDVGPGGFALTILPLGLLAGFGAVGLFERLIGARSRLAWSGIFVGSLVILTFAFISLAGLASPSSEESTSETIVRFLLIAIVVLIPVGYLIVKAGERLEGIRIALTVATAVLIIGGVGVRAAVLSTTEWQGAPGNLLTAPAMGDDIPVVIDRIHRISRDLTRTERDARMPVGGIGLRIALDEEIEQPFAWYFREYPNLTIFDPEQESVPEGTQVVILAGSRDPAEAAPGFPGASYVYQYDEPDYIDDPSWADLAGDIFGLDGWRDFFGFMLNRETNQPVPASEFHLQAIPLIAERFAISTGPYNLDDQAGIGTAGGQFSQPRGIAFDDQGSLYVVDGGNTRIQHFDAVGGFEGVLAEGALAPFPSGAGGAGGLAIDEAGNLYVADTWNHQIKVFSPSGEQIRAWGSFFDAMDDPELVTTNGGQFYGPRDLAIHDGMLYVTDTGNERVQVFTLEGEFVQMFGEFGSGEGQLIEPVGIVVTEDGAVLVADSHNARIARFDLDGEPLEAWPVELWVGQQFFEPYLEVGPSGRVYASDSPSGQIAVFDPNGTPLPTIIDAGLLRPYDMAVSPDGLQMLVTDGLANAVIRVSLTPAG